MPARLASFGMTFYNWKNIPHELGCAKGGFPKSVDKKYTFVAFHISWNKAIQPGYKVVFIPFDDNGNPIAQPIDLLWHNGTTAKWLQGIHPVDVQLDECG
jgi:hypothetical protein